MTRRISHPQRQLSAALAALLTLALLALPIGAAHATPPTGSLAPAGPQPTLYVGRNDQPGGGWVLSLDGGSWLIGDTVTITVDDSDGGNCLVNGDHVGFSSLPTVTVGATTPAGGTPVTVVPSLRSSNAACAALGVTDQLVLALASTSAAGQTIAITGIRYDLGNTVATGALSMTPTAEHSTPPGTGAALPVTGAVPLPPTVSNVVATSNNPPTALKPATGNQPVSDVVLTETQAAGIPAGTVVCLSINSPSGPGAPAFTPSSAPTVLTNGNGATVANGVGGPVGTVSPVTLGPAGGGPGTPPFSTLAFKVVSTSVSPATFTITGLRLDTGTATGPVIVGVGTGATIAAACGSGAGGAAGATPSLGNVSSPTVAPIDPFTRLAGADRRQTAIAISASRFPTVGSAGAVVLANELSFADALAGTPLAITKHAPLLLTGGSALDPAVAAEIQRVLPAGGTVYVLGQEGALSASVADALQALGFTVTRLGGPTRFATATEIASLGLGDPGTAFEATGVDFADALAGGAAAGVAHAAVLLTNGATQAAETAAYLAAHPSVTRVALGGPAAAADPTASPIVGSDRYATSALVAGRFFPTPTVVGAASGLSFADATAGGAHIGSLGGPLLLVPPAGAFPSSVLSYLTSHAATITHGWLYGGPLVVNDGIASMLATAIS